MPISFSNPPVEVRPNWHQIQPTPPPPVPVVAPVSAAPSDGSGARSSAEGQGAIYRPARPAEASATYARPAVDRGTIRPEPENGTAAADVATVNAPAPVASPASSARATRQALANAAYAMVVDAPGATSAPLCHPSMAAEE